MRAKALGMTALATAVLTLQAPAHADEIDELKARLQQLAAEIEALKAKQAEADKRLAQTPAQAASAEGEGKRYVTEGDLPGSFKVPGTDTSVKIGGFVALDVTKDFDGGGFGGTLALPHTIALPGQAQDSRSGQFSVTARRSRLNLTTLTPTDYGELRLFVEGDFYGAGGNEYQTNSAAFRLRHAFADIGPWTVGQTFTTFWEPGSAVEIVDFQGGNGAPSVPRQPLIRYTGKIGENTEFSLAAENPESEVEGVPNTTYVAGIGVVPTNTVDKVPDLVARYVTTGDWGRFGVAGMFRRMTFNNIGSAPVGGYSGEQSVNGYGLMVMGKFNTFGRDSLQYNLVGGPGMGRYLLGSPASASVIDNGELDTIKSWGAQLGYQRVWDATWRSNLVIGRVKADYPHPAVPVTELSQVDVLWLNHVWNPSPRYYVGIEWVHARVKADGIGGAVTDRRNHANRLDASFRFAF